MRLGKASVDHIYSHPFFTGLPWKVRSSSLVSLDARASPPPPPTSPLLPPTVERIRLLLKESWRAQNPHSMAPTCDKCKFKFVSSSLSPSFLTSGNGHVALWCWVHADDTAGDSRGLWTTLFGYPGLPFLLNLLFFLGLLSFFSPLGKIRWFHVWRVIGTCPKLNFHLFLPICMLWKSFHIIVYFSLISLMSLDFYYLFWSRRFTYAPRSVTTSSLATRWLV